MREQVKDNGEFIQRIRELEDDKQELQEDLKSQLSDSEALKGQIEDLNAEIVTQQNR